MVANAINVLTDNCYVDRQLMLAMGDSLQARKDVIPCMDMPHVRETDPADPSAMEETGRIAAECHEYLETLLEVGQSTVVLDREAESFVRDLGAEPAFFDYGSSEHTITVSINDQIIHTPPKPDRTISNGDIVSIDLGAKYEGHYSDTAVTHLVGAAKSSNHEKLIERARSALYAGILRATAGNTLKDIGEAIEEEAGEFGNVTAWAGHFIGRKLHLEPQVYNTADQNESFSLDRGMYLAIEPILTESADARTLEREPGGTVRTRSGRVGAHFEHTVRVGADRATILTSRSDEPDSL